MALHNCTLLLVLSVIAMVAASPVPEPGYYGGGYHEHYLIHAPFNVHTVHYYHVKKVHVPVYVKEVYHGWHPWD